MSSSSLPATAEGPPPAGLCVSLHPSVRILGHGRVLIGGVPMRAVTLTPRGAEVVTRWATPAPIGSGSGRQTLARRLLDAGMLDPRPNGGVAGGELTFVVPVRDRLRQLERCLSALARAAPEARVVVVDDGSRPPVRAAWGERVQVIRHPVSRGPAAARNTGLVACSTPFVGFVDSDVVLPEAAAGRLLGHFADPGIAAVAPRIRALGGRGAVSGYEARHSALDMGPTGGLVAPGRPVSYVPSAVLFGRRTAIVPGFDESLAVGEDVDFVWRLWAAGGRVRYAPEVEVRHEHPATVRQFIARRHAYARSVGVLARRHGDALPAVWISPAAALVWGLAVLGRGRLLAAVVVWSWARMQARVTAAAPGAHRLAAALALRGLGHAGLGLSQAIRRAWSPALLALAGRQRRARWVLAAAVAVGIAQDGLRSGSPRAALVDVPLGILAEVIAAAGTWQGCLTARTIRPLLPSLGAPPRSAR